MSFRPTRNGQGLFVITVPRGQAKAYVLWSSSQGPQAAGGRASVVGTFSPLFAAPTAGGDSETTPFRFTSSAEGGASGEQRCERSEPHAERAI
jgi:hypothetical protein